MDGSPLAEACDVFLDHDREPDGDTATAADLLVEVLNQRTRGTRQRLEQITDEDLLDLERDPETSPSLRWEAQVALGRGKRRANRNAARRASASRACLDYWNVSVAEWQARSGL
jgi:hypothetical protein